MALIKKSRKIRPSTHDDSDPYRVSCEKVSSGDILQIHVTHESDSTLDMLYQIAYKDLNGNKSIHFMAYGSDKGLRLEWLDNIKPHKIN